MERKYELSKKKVAPDIHFKSDVKVNLKQLMIFLHTKSKHKKTLSNTL